MVNTGKPSGACLTCKNRRIKCDETRPCCMRCLSSNRTCFGYPRRNSLEIRDETISVQRKVAQTAAKHRKKLQAGAARDVDLFKTPANASQQQLQSLQETLESETFPTGIVVESTIPSASILKKVLGAPIQDVAICYFFQRYTPPPKAQNAPGLFLANLADLYARAIPASPLYHATHSLALAVLANLTHQQWIRQRALISYGESLHTLARAVADKDYAKEDSVITASLLICMFELLSCTYVLKDQTNSTFSVENYRSHLKGLALLIRNRGIDQFRNPRSLGLFRAVRHQLLLQAIQISEPLHPFWTSDRILTGHDYLEASRAHLDRVAAQIPTLQARINQFYAHLVEDVDVLAVLLQAYDLDRQLIECYRDLLKSCFRCDFKCLNVVGQDEVPNAPIDPNTSNYLVHASYYNHFRMYRIHVQSIIIRCLMLAMQPAELERDCRYMAAIELSRRLATEICNNVSVFLERNDAKPRLDDKSKQDANTKSMAGGSLGMLLQIWPMFIVHALEIVPKEQRSWIEEKLEVAADMFGFHHAKVLKLVKPYLLFGQLHR